MISFEVHTFVRLPRTVSCIASACKLTNFAIGHDFSHQAPTISTSKTHDLATRQPYQPSTGPLIPALLAGIFRLKSAPTGNVLFRRKFVYFQQKKPLEISHFLVVTRDHLSLYVKKSHACCIFDSDDPPYILDNDQERKTLKAIRL
ncbi:hypothetical protein KFK09_026694 [Dendrobium nobile]|uniref:Uncharacterized protein n=1 Tax=Dendrobium nobile TaxID=94219 RepID=A0A8T3A9F1_DENNO|nr:hypothetical protein KFK09_026694 [Dendrobium nobile]